MTRERTLLLSDPGDSLGGEKMIKPRASRKMSIVLEFNQYGEFTGTVCFNAENEKDQIILQEGVSRLLRPWNLTLKKVIYERSGK